MRTRALALRDPSGVTVVEVEGRRLWGREVEAGRAEDVVPGRLEERRGPPPGFATATPLPRWAHSPRP